MKTPWNRVLRVRGDGQKITESAFVAVSHPLRRSTDRLLLDAAAQVRDYCRGRLRRFDLPLLLEGTQLQHDAWACVAALEFGDIVSYADIARAIARPGAHRGVAAAMSAAPLALFIPAHRVVGSDGRVRGANPGSMRVTLLEFEQNAGTRKLTASPRR